MTLAGIQQIISLYLAHDQPDAMTAKKEIESWLRNQQANNEIHAYLVYWGPSNNTIIIDVQTTPSGLTHTLQFTESQWLNNHGLPPPPSSHSTSPGTPAPVVDFDEDDHDTNEQDTANKDYERAMGILL